MSSPTRRALYGIHSYAGLVFGVYLFLLCLSGTLVVFRDELRVWGTPALRELHFDGKQSASLDRIVETFSARYELSEPKLFAFRLPSSEHPFYELLLPRAGRGLVHAYAHPLSGEYLGEARVQLGDFLFQLHANLSLRKKLGRYLVGAGGLALMLLVLTGLVLHRTMFRELFTMRWSGARRAVASDGHKAAGTWMLPFHFIIALSGTFLALKDLFVLVPALAIYDGDLRRARAELTEAPIVAQGIQTEMASLDVMLASARNETPELRPTLVVLHEWGDVRARVDLAGSLPGHLLPKNEAVRYRFRGRDGQRVERRHGLHHGPWLRIADAMSPLHYGDFGNRWLRLMYFFGGLCALTLTFTGTLMWLERVQRRLARPRNGQ
ncbi:MAG: PepSY domain-containing protein [Proteobacteria bacterium]|nr:PepSY domain-containing protein [Pseudomonadota bacterium]